MSVHTGPNHMWRNSTSLSEICSCQNLSLFSIYAF